MALANRLAEVSYTPGTWLGVVRSGTVVLLRPDTDRALVDSLWTLLAADPEIHEVLDAVTSASGGSLARLPWFGIVGLRGSLQVFLRGEIDLDVRLDGGESVALSGRDVTTWAERRFAAAEGFSVAVPTAPPVSPAAPLPLGEGVVLLQGLHCGLTGNPPAAEVRPDAVPLAAVPDAVPAALPGAAPEAAVEDQLLAAAEADIAAELSELGSSADTVLELPEEDLDAGPETEVPAPPPPEPAEPKPAESEPAESEPAEQEPTGSYDHLWEQTVMRNIEDAAVREDPEAEEEPAPEPSDAGEPDPAAAAIAPAEEQVEEPAALPAPEPAARPAVPSGLIDSVPWRTGGERTPAAPLAPRGPVAPPSLFTPPSPQLPASQVPEPSGDADHDGQTIMKSALIGSPAASPGHPKDPGRDTAKDPGTGPMVLARVCPQGHANPPTNAQCAYCGQALPGDGVQVRRPRLGRMRLSTGELIDLDQSLIVGRQPSVSRVQGAVMPKLVQVASPGGDISRSHVEVRLEGWHVMLCDLKATNGTVLLREGQAPRRLAQGEMAILFDGDIAELGDGIQLRFEELL
ncbi:FHA domain-containing protein [Arthrobacter sp. C9C5]|uniref:FHA domain-containing protein n=1 Tax=Arthrobacter sp. C9C5 TaxID=2735267 RepID=UPI00158505C9|nr:FHA domain-containing protein [Arthrobacter sp. C9C5]NUU33283.1 FHA domain-containing protein [Arthrobacter sp. C9C5]